MNSSDSFQDFFGGGNKFVYLFLCTNNVNNKIQFRDEIGENMW